MSSYSPPEWSAAPEHDFHFEVIRGGSAIATVPLSSQCYYLFGRQADACDVPLEHPSASRVHCALQHRGGADGAVFLFDLGSTHGTYLNKQRIAPREFHRVRVGDCVKFGESTRIYQLNGPVDLQPPERERGGGSQSASSSASASISHERMQQLAAANASRAARARIDTEVSWGMAPDELDEGGGMAGGMAGGDADLGNDFKAWLDYARAGTLTGASAGHVEGVAKLMAKVEKCERKIENSERELNNLRLKAGAGGAGDSGGAFGGAQSDRQQRVSTQLHHYRQELANLEDDVRDAIDVAMGRNVSGGGGGATKRASRSRDSDDDDDDDAFFDRTASASKQRGGATSAGAAAGAGAASSGSAVVVVGGNVAETAESLALKLDAMQRRVKEAEGAAARAQSKAVRLREALQRAEDEDPLGAYMQKIQLQQHEQETKKLEVALAADRAEEKRLHALLKLVAASTSLPVAAVQARAAPPPPPPASHSHSSSANSSSSSSSTSAPSASAHAASASDTHAHATAASERRPSPPAAAAAAAPPPPPQFAQPKLKPKVPAIGPLLPPTALPSGAVRLELDASRADADEHAAAKATSEHGGSSRGDADDEAESRAASSLRASDGVFGGGSGSGGSASAGLDSLQVARQRQQQGNDAVAQYQALSQNTSRVSAGAMSGGLVVRAKSKQPGAGAGAGLDAAAGSDAEHGKRRKVGGATDADGAPSSSSSLAAASAHSYGDDADVTWRPPVGQRGDGRTAANAKFGY